MGSTVTRTKARGEENGLSPFKSIHEYITRAFRYIYTDTRGIFAETATPTEYVTRCALYAAARL